MTSSKQLIVAISRQLIKAVVALVVAVLVITFTSRQIATIVKSLEENRRLAALLENRSTSTVLLQKDIENIKNKEKALYNALLKTDDILEYVGSMESIAGKSSLKQSLQFGAPSPYIASGSTMKISRLDHTVSLNGSIATLTKYVKLHEKIPYLAGINSISIAASSEDIGWEGDTRSNISASVYVK